MARPPPPLPLPDGDYHVADLSSEAQGTWVNGRRLPLHSTTRLVPGDALSFGPGGTQYRVKLQHASLLEGGEHGRYNRRGAQEQPRELAVQ